VTRSASITPLESIEIARPTLDDVFLKATGRRLEGDDETEEASA
jgi:hypothetical protein